MNNHLLLTIATLLFTLLLFGCSESKNVVEKNTVGKINQDIPKPFTKAIIAINHGNWELADTYLDLVISDFSDSEYVLAAQILKGSMKVSQFQGAYDLILILNSGIIPNSSIYISKDIEALNRHLSIAQDISKKSINELEDIVTYIVKNFSLYKDYIGYFKNIAIVSNGESYNNLSFFEDVGYPIPSDSDVEKFLNTNYTLYSKDLIYGLTLNTENPKYNVLPLFSSVVMYLVDENPTLAKELFNIILDITYNDIYNEYRISTEKLLNSFNIEEEQNEEPNSLQVNTQVETKDNSNINQFEWGLGIKDTFENKMNQSKYAYSKDNLIYKNGFIGADNQGYYEVYTINTNGKEQYIGVVNVKTGWYHGYFY